MLAAAAQVVGEVGYGGMSVARVTDRAGVSRRTFYEQFEDREDCFLALFEEALERAGRVARAGATAAVAAEGASMARAGPGGPVGAAGARRGRAGRSARC